MAAHDGRAPDSVDDHSETHGEPPRHLHGAVASHFLAQPRDAYGGETWTDVLREAGVDTARLRPPSTPSSASASPPPLPRPDTPSSGSSADRKRRLTTADSPRRRPSNMRLHSSNAGSSADPIVLDADTAPLPARDRPLPVPPLYETSSTPSRPPPSHNARPSHTPRPAHTPRPSRRESDLVLPPWQPDSDVTQCPVCSRHFTFLFRKHHCRKCGRVVCSQCSPHRITIPRQFIVHPPSDGSNSIIDLTGDDDANPMSNFGPFRNPALGGGEEVRVCNPCVPDPNYSLPPHYPSSSGHAYGRPNPPPTPSARPDYTPGPAVLHHHAHRSSSSAQTAPQHIAHGQRNSSRDAHSSRRVSYHDASRSEDRWPSPLPNPGHAYHPHNRQHERSSSSSHLPTGSSYISHPPQQRAGPDSGSARGAHMFPRPFFLPSAQPPSIQQLNPRPRRQIAEEDECPICGGELPPKGPDGDDSARAQHVEECIALHSSSPAPTAPARPQPQTSASLPATRTRGMSSAGGNGEGASSHRHSHAARGMFPYTATEKDCVDEDGHDAECVICFEEFQPGDKMARLVCWCKFHEKCIKDWWNMKGRGACPTHQLHEE